MTNEARARLYFKIRSINISSKRGEKKRPVNEVGVIKIGIVGDAHAGAGLRQISLLSSESIELFSREKSKAFKYGDFAENLTTEDLTSKDVKIFDQLKIGPPSRQVILEVTAKGKKCHDNGCSIKQEVGTCVMPSEGIFTRVIKPGTLVVDDDAELLPRTLKTAIIILSDRAYNEPELDKSTETLTKQLEIFSKECSWNLDLEKNLIPDDKKQLKKLIEDYATDKDLIICCGGTGISERDITIDTVSKLSHKTIPGIMEHIRLKYADKHPNSLLSRSLACTINKALIYCIPGSPKAVNEYMPELNKITEHAIFMLKGLDHS